MKQNLSLPIFKIQFADREINLRKLFFYRIALTLSFLFGLYTLNSRVMAQNLSNYESSWVGNTFGKGLNQDRTDGKWVQDLISGSVVGQNGMVYTAAGWDEGGRSAGVYGGKMVNGVEIGNVFGSLSTGDCVNETGKVGKEYTANGITVAVNNNNAYAVFNGVIYQYSLQGCNGQSFIGQNAISLYATDTRLLAVDNNIVRLFELPSKNKLKEFTVTNAGPCSIAPNGDLWIITGVSVGDFHGRKAAFWIKNGEPVIQHFSSDGVYIDQISNPSDQSTWWPTHLAFDNSGRLMVSDAGNRRQVLFFDTSSKQVVDKLGQEGGISAGTTGIIAPDKFFGQMQSGMDKNNNIFVICEGMGQSIRKFTQGKTHLWTLTGLGFTESGHADPYTDGLDIYTPNEHYKLDLSKTTPGTEWSLYSYTLDRIKYPNDPRNNNWVTSGIIRNIKGSRILFTYGMFGGGLNYYKFDNETAVPVGSFDSGTWALMPDDAGNFWYVKDNNIYKKAFTGFASNGDPTWADAQIFASNPGDIKDLQRIEYIADQDILYLVGDIPSGDWGIIGSKMAKYDKWGAGNRQATWVKPIPYAQNGESPGKLRQKAIAFSKDYIFTVGVETRKVTAYKVSDGSLVGTMEGGAEINGANAIGWVDIPYGMRATSRSNGEQLVLVEDNGFAKILMYRWCPSGNCAQTTVAVSGISISPATLSIDLGSSSSIIATVQPSTASDKGIIWSSSNPSVATVNSNGLLTAVAEGQTTIQAKSTSDGSKIATSIVTVKKGSTTTGTKIYEAENGVLSGNNIYDCSSCSNGKMVGSNVVGSSITINNVDGGSGGSASLVIKYSADNNRRATLYVNGANAGKINWGSGSYGTWRDQSINITLNSGSTNSIKISQDADDNGSYVCADVDKLTVTPTTVTLRDPENPSNPVNGINYSYYTGTWSQLPDFNGLAPVKTGNSTSGFDISPRMQEVNYAFKYTGYISIPADGTYTFYTSSDDGSKLYIGDKEVVNNDGLHAVIEANGQIGLKAGRHAITVTFFQQGGGQSLAVSYDGPGLSKTLVPVSALYIQGSTSVTKVYEAENGVLSGNNIYNSTSCSNGKMVGSNLVGSSITINNVDGGTGGSASLVIKYSADNNRRATLYVNGANAGKINWGSGSYGTWRDQSISITLNSGTTNSIKISQDADDNGSYVCADVDKLTLTTTGSSARYANGGEKNIKPSLKEDYETIVYPNPTNDKVNFSFNTQESGTGDIKFVTMQGETLKTHHFNYSKGENKVSTSVPDQSGNIIIAYLNAGKVKKAFKLIIQR